ncbi:hypothetical protein QUB60_14390 [Microcoleus sp. A2-C5]|uniref:hypothetical protein n=1 Tax=unclassified Microcoleus TaxID=2642155 RepID=UPI002FD6670D
MIFYRIVFPGLRSVQVIADVEGRRKKAEGRRQKAEGRRQKAKGRRQKAEGYNGCASG